MLKTPFLRLFRILIRKKKVINLASSEKEDTDDVISSQI